MAAGIKAGLCLGEPVAHHPVFANLITYSPDIYLKDKRRAGEMKRWDLFNRNKKLWDLISEFAGFDDCQIVGGTNWKMPGLMEQTYVEVWLV